jgi:phosphoribosyl 1,2-cyclic phosphate phosphodiesterase
LQWIARLAPRRAVLTNMHIDLDYETLRARLPEHIVPAHDGMTLEIAESQTLADEKITRQSNTSR